MLPDGYDYKKYLPTDEDFAKVLECKQSGKTWNLFTFDTPPYYYEAIRRYLACILLKWEEGGKTIERYALGGHYEYVNGVNTLIPYFTEEDLAELRSLAVTYKNWYLDTLKKYAHTAWNLESPEKRVQKLKDERKGQIEVKSSGKGIYRIIPYSMKYGWDPNKKASGAKMHLFFGKKESDKFKIVIRGANLYGSGKDAVKDAPYFLTEQEARDFIANVDHNHIDTKVSLEDWRFVISNAPMQGGWIEVGRKVVNGVDYGPEWGHSKFEIMPEEVVKVDTICGPAYMLKTCKYLKTDEGLEEAIEKHDTLNQKLFDGTELKQEVKDKVEEITNEMIRLLTEDGVKLIVRDVILTGSNVSYNYTKDSDIDLHILAETPEVDDPDELYPKLYNAYRRIFQNKYDVTFYGIPVEPYIEMAGNSNLVSNGVYSVMFDKWIKEPELINIPDIDQAEIDKAAKPWKDEAEEILKQEDIQKIDDYINRIYEMRQKGLYNTDGVEFSTENLIFKEVRNAGLLDKLKQYRDELTGKELSLESLNENMLEKERREYVLKIARLTYYQPIVHSDGKFEIHLVKEADVSYVLSVLRRQDWVEDCHSIPGKFDFSHVSSFSLPSRYHTIMGKIRTPQKELTLEL